MKLADICTTVALPLVLLALAAWQLIVGGNALPIWLSAAGLKSGADPLFILRIVIALECVLALLLIFGGTWRTLIAWTGLVLLGFTALADVAAAFRRDAWLELVIALLVLTVVATIARFMARAEPSTTSNTNPSRHVGARLLGFILLTLLSLGLVLNLPMGKRTTAEGVPVQSDAPPNVNGNVQVVELGIDTWVGTRLSGTKLAASVPDLPRFIGENDAIIVLYNPTCGTCHDLIATHLSEPGEIPVYAIEVPHPPGAALAPSDAPKEIDCDHCTKLSLPTGPLWLLQPPVVLRVENGVVTCLATNQDPSFCFENE